MADTVSDLLFERLREWGVHRIFGYLGDGINGILGALAQSEGDGGAVAGHGGDCPRRLGSGQTEGGAP